MTNSNDFARQGQNVADTAADHVQSGIRSAQQTGDRLSSGVEQARSHVGSTIKQAADDTQNFVGQGVDQARAGAQRVYQGASDASESIVTYTKENPVKAMLIAAASGALIVTLANALARSRD